MGGLYLPENGHDIMMATDSSGLIALLHAIGKTQTLTELDLGRNDFFQASVGEAVAFMLAECRTLTRFTMDSNPCVWGDPLELSQDSAANVIGKAVVASTLGHFGKLNISRLRSDSCETLVLYRITPQIVIALGGLLQQQKSLTEIDISYSAIHIHGIEALSAGLAGTSVTTLLLNACAICGVHVDDCDDRFCGRSEYDNRGLICLVSTVVALPLLTNLDISRNCIGPQGALIVADMVRNSHIKCLNIGHNEIAGIEGYYPQGPESSFTSAEADYDLEGLTAIAEALQTSMVEQINFTGNRIGKQGASLLATACCTFASNETLSHIRLRETVWMSQCNTWGYAFQKHSIPLKPLRLKGASATKVDLSGLRIGDIELLFIATVLELSTQNNQLQRCNDRSIPAILEIDLRSNLLCGLDFHFYSDVEELDDAFSDLIGESHTVNVMRFGNAINETLEIVQDFLDEVNFGEKQPHVHLSVIQRLEDHLMSCCDGCGSVPEEVQYSISCVLHAISLMLGCNTICDLPDGTTAEFNTHVLQVIRACGWTCGELDRTGIDWLRDITAKSEGSLKLLMDMQPSINPCQWGRHCKAQNKTQQKMTQWVSAIKLTVD